jgi:hypothetical protein
MSSDDDSAWNDTVRPKVVSGPTPSSVNTIKNNSGLWQPDMTLFNFEQIQKASLANLGMVATSENKNKTNNSNSIDQTADTTNVMTQQLQQSAENAKNDSLATDNNTTIKKVDAFQTIENFETSFVFPYKTLENVRENSIVKQPYSAFINLLTCIMIIYFLMKTKTFHGFLLIGSILLFELFHTFSHTVHLKNIYYLQTKILHSLALVVNASLIYTLYKYSKKDLPMNLVLFIILLLVFDNYAFKNLHISYYINTQIIIFFSIIYYYYPYIKKFFTSDKIKLYTIGFIVGYLAFMNETVNGEYIMNHYSNIPFHIIVEISVFILFYAFVSSLYKI